jgi:hypothetical protein
VWNARAVQVAPYARAGLTASRIIRRLRGITYWVFPDKREIRGFINSNIKKEWEKDDFEDRTNPQKDGWLLSLPKRKWNLQEIDIDSIMLNHEMLARDAFTTRLEERSNELRKVLSEYNAVIWPLVIRGEDFELKDGYCRYTTLKKMGVSRTLAYVGFLGPLLPHRGRAARTRHTPCQ